MHEPADYLNARFCASAGDGPLCDIVAYKDDQLSHVLCFAGLLGIDKPSAAEAAVYGEP